MTDLHFTLLPDGCLRLHDALNCLGRFSDAISLVARERSITLSCLNSSRSAYASFVFDAEQFFQSFHFSSTAAGPEGSFACRVMNRALLSVFKARLLDNRGRESAVERCEVSLQERDDRVDCRLLVKMFCKHGVIKTYNLMYESIEYMQAIFDKDAATNSWCIGSRLLREYIEYFAAKTEQLDFFCTDGKMTMTSYTEKISNGKEILKQPLETAITIDTDDFVDFKAKEDQHIAISVKDFKNIVTHAETLRTDITAMYSNPGQPLQFSYIGSGVRCEFTLMTIGDSKNPANATSTTTTTAAPKQAKPKTQPAKVNRANQQPPATQAPPASSSRHSRPLGSRVSNNSHGTNTPADPDPEGLFLPVYDDDRVWDPVEEREEEDETLGWNPSAGDGAPLRGSASVSRQFEDIDEGKFRGLTPTQRVSQVRGMFD